MENLYVQQRDGAYWIRGTRISLDSIVISYQQGFSAETIVRECFPSLTLEQVYGAIAYYLGHRNEIDSYLQQADAEHQQLRESTQTAARNLTEKLTKAQRDLLAPKS